MLHKKEIQGAPVMQEERYFCVQDEFIPVTHGFLGRHCEQDNTSSWTKHGAGNTLSSKKNPFIPHQNHTNNVLVLSPDHPETDMDQLADAVVTCQTNRPIGVKTADCTPVLFWDPCGVIGAAHAGYRGAASGILENTVHAMMALGAQPHTLRAVIGPTIRVRSYPVGKEFFSSIQDQSPFSIAPFVYKERFFNLPAYVQHRLCQVMDNVHDVHVNTYGIRFFSHRYLTLLGLPSTQRQRNISWINLPAKTHSF
jgi:YfiH family protein